MARLGARYQHFFAKGKLYKHFWAGTEALNGTATGSLLTVTRAIINGATQSDNFLTGQTLTRNVSLIAGAGSGDGNASGVNILETALLFPGVATGTANADGFDFGLNVTLIPGSTSSDGTAPLNTRLNARYRHFGFRNQTWRHFWAQWEGEAIFPAGGNILLIAMVLVEIGASYGDANADGQTLTRNVSLIPGTASGASAASGATLDVAASLIPGDVSADAHTQGAGGDLTVEASILAGIFVPGQIVTAHAAILPGIVATNVIVSGDVLPVDVTLEAGLPTTQVNANGETITVNAEIIGGDAFGTGSALAFGDRMQVACGIIDGQATGENVEPIAGSLLVVNASIIAGTAFVINPEDGIAIGKTIVCTVSLIPGVASNELIPPSQGVRVGGPVSLTKKREKVEEINAQAFGGTVVSIAAIIGGLATGEDNTFPSPSIVPELGVPSVTTIEHGAKAEGVSLSFGMSLLAGKATGNADQIGDTLEGRTWNAYDRDVLRVLELIDA